MRTSLIATLLGAATIAVCAPAQAQTRNVAPQLEVQQGQVQPGPGDRTQPPRSANKPRRPGSVAERPDSTSDQLSRTQGVLQPPDTGDAGVQPPPSTGNERTPVIPPPGTPGGRQDLQPK